MNKKFLQHESDGSEAAFENRVHDSDENLSEDEKNINLQEEFEHKYNFRFEENDPEFIKRCIFIYFFLSIYAGIPDISKEFLNIFLLDTLEPWKIL